MARFLEIYPVHQVVSTSESLSVGDERDAHNAAGWRELIYPADSCLE